MGAELLHVDRQTDIHMMKLIVTVWNFANMPENICLFFGRYLANTNNCKIIKTGPVLVKFRLDK